MALLNSFRRSIYLTLGIACVCLHYAEGGFLPETPYITGLVLALLFVGYRLEGRWSLTLHAANMVGAALTLLLVGWVAFQFLPQRRSVLSQIAFPANLLPYLGPVLMILIPVKLFRPKHVGDFWAMQGIGLLAVALGCAMANDVVFGILLIIYLCSFVWSMTLFYLYREIRPDRNSHSAGASSRRFFLFGVAGRWSALIVAAGLVLFLILPRPNDRKWELPMRIKGKMETGVTDGNLDLNRTGPVEPNKEIAFEVFAQDINQYPILDLNSQQRWRSRSLAYYDSGRWSSQQGIGLTVLDRTANKRWNPSQDDLFTQMKERLPDFGSQRYFLTFSIRQNSGAQNVLADPVLWRAGDFPPIMVFGSRAGSVQQRLDGNFEWLGFPEDGRPSYCQVEAPTSDPNLGPPMRIPATSQAALTQMAQGQAQRLRHWTIAVLERLAADGRLPAAALERDIDGRFPAAHHEVIARALERYFTASGEFTYTLKLERSDPKLDPVEDFLYNTKSGHCQRYASALTLMLRSVDVPAQIVLGFKGCEPLGDGNYLVRQLNAHAWVEVLIPRDPPTWILPRIPHDHRWQAGKPSFHWLSLDPTPAGDGAAEETVATDWLATSESFFKNFILFYDASSREKAMARLVATFQEMSESLESGEIPWPVALVGGAAALIAAVLLFRTLRRRARRKASPHSLAPVQVAFHQHLLRLLAKHGWEIWTGETPMEFARRVARDLRGEPATAATADIPLQIAGAYYKVRFGEGELTPSERQELDEAVELLARTLQKPSTQAAPA